MIKRIIDRIIGRVEVVDEIISIDDALELLRGINGNTKGNIIYNVGLEYLIVPEIAPKDIIEFVGNEFPEGRDYYTNYTKVRYRVYSYNKGYEKHFLHLSYGWFEGLKIKDYPHRKATISFITKEQKEQG